MMMRMNLMIHLVSSRRSSPSSLIAPKHTADHGNTHGLCRCTCVSITCFNRCAPVNKLSYQLTRYSLSLSLSLSLRRKYLHHASCLERSRPDAVLQRALRPSAAGRVAQCAGAGPGGARIDAAASGAVHARVDPAPAAAAAATSAGAAAAARVRVASSSSSSSPAAGAHATRGHVSVLCAAE